ncbi:uncharacterized protein LOC123529108 [Mercenaria mercenaria]|uniref:uncharacterized protein LOC123529108 n=1 Tax=Mercenaria mercenaria TaxID=6596 RepID=UPI00234EAF2A|nr:uncharacterized protein LOC123529108 [Mercenaria mercenaria]
MPHLNKPTCINLWIQPITETLTIEENLNGKQRRGASQRGTIYMRSTSRSLRYTRRQNLLLTRKVMRFGTWNVRTMYEGGRSANVAKGMRSYNLQVLGLCKTRLINSSETRLGAGETLIYSGHKEADAPHTEGVGIVMSKEAAQALIGWEPINSRILMAKFRTSNKRITLATIMCYGPTNDAEEKVKEDFYDRLQTVINDRHDRAVVILIGGFQR